MTNCYSGEQLQGDYIDNTSRTSILICIQTIIYMYYYYWLIHNKTGLWYVFNGHVYTVTGNTIIVD